MPAVYLTAARMAENAIRGHTDVKDVQRLFSRSAAPELDTHEVL